MEEVNRQLQYFEDEQLHNICKSKWHMEGILESRADLDVDPGVMVLELILFLKDWGLWIDINIFAGGKRYSYEEGSCFKGTTGWRD